jgi:primosomal protein N' (replication factor Y)
VALSAGATGVLADGATASGFIVATPGAVPAARGGYAAAVVIGAEAPASGGLGAEVRAVRWWLGVAALVRSRGDGGRVYLVGALPDAARRALETWDPVTAAQDALAERAELSLPPARRSVQLVGAKHAISLALSVSVEGERLERHREANVTETKDGALMLVTRRSAQSIIDALRARQVELSKDGDEGFRMRVDGPLNL